MKKKHHYRMLFVLLAAGLLCSCGTAVKKETPQLEAYNGFAYTEENGQKNTFWKLGMIFGFIAIFSRVLKNMRK